VTGRLFEGGPLWLWAEIINGKNAWYLDDSSTYSGQGTGSEHGDWKTRLNLKPRAVLLSRQRDRHKAGPID